MAGPPMAPPPDGADSTSDRQAFFPWFVDTPLAWVGAGVTGVGLVGSIAFGIAAASAKSSSDSVSEAIEAERQRLDNVPDGRQPCGPEDDPSQDLDHYAAHCNALRDNISAYDTDVVGAVVLQDLFFRVDLDLFWAVIAIVMIARFFAHKGLLKVNLTY